MSDRDCEKCKHHTEKGCDSWDCEFEQRMTKEDIHREKEQAYMQGYEDACKKYRKEPCEDAISRQAVLDAIEDDNRNGHYSCFASNNDAQCFKGVIDELPSVNPQEPKTDVLDKIKAEIEDLVFDYSDDYHLGYNLGLIRATQVIDKYKAESEE